MLRLPCAGRGRPGSMHTEANGPPFWQAPVLAVVPRLRWGTRREPGWRERRKRQARPQFRNQTAFRPVFPEDFVPRLPTGADVHFTIALLAGLDSSKSREHDRQRTYPT